MFEVVTEGRTGISIQEEYQGSPEDANAVYRRSFLTDVNFQHAVIEARQEDTEIKKIEGARRGPEERKAQERGGKGAKAEAEAPAGTVG